jgi:hypothetical protein
MVAFYLELSMFANLITYHTHQCDPLPGGPTTPWRTNTFWPATVSLCARGLFLYGAAVCSDL